MRHRLQPSFRRGKSASKTSGETPGRLIGRAAGLLFLHDFMVFSGAILYLENYEGFSEEAILMLACVAANLIALILAIKSGDRYPKPIKAPGGEEALPQ